MCAGKSHEPARQVQLTLTAGQFGGLLRASSRQGRCDGTNDRDVASVYLPKVSLFSSLLFFFRQRFIFYRLASRTIMWCLVMASWWPGRWRSASVNVNSNYHIHFLRTRLPKVFIGWENDFCFIILTMADASRPTIIMHAISLQHFYFPIKNNFSTLYVLPRMNIIQCHLADVLL